jgi:uncharacterized protein YndB with AHSA1/START domain
MSEYGSVVEPGTVRFVRRLPGPIERVFAYLVDSELRRTWFAAGPLEPRVGGAVHFVFHHKEIAPPSEVVPEKYQKEDGVELHGRVTRCEPPRLLAFTWDDSEVSFELEARSAEVILTLTHRKLAGRTEMVDVSGGWHLHLDVLRQRLSGAKTERFWTALEELDREYEARTP